MNFNVIMEMYSTGRGDGRMRAIRPRRSGAGIGLRRRFLLIFCCFVVLPTAAFILFFTHSHYRYAISNTIEGKYGLLNQMEKNIDSRLSNFQNNTMMFYHNRQILSYINAGDYSRPCEAISFYLNSLVNTERNVVAVTLFLDGQAPQTVGSTLFLGDDFFDRHTPAVMERGGRLCFIPTTRTSSTFQPDVRAFALARAINDAKGPVGSMWIFISTDFFGDILEEPGLIADGTLAYVVSGDQVMASSDAPKSGARLDAPWLPQALKMGEGHFTFQDGDSALVIAATRIPRSGWSILSVTPMSSILQGMRYIPMMAVAVFALYLLFVLAMYLTLQRMMFRPIAQLHRGLRKVSKGDFGHKIPRRYQDEIGELTDTYNDMTARIQSLMDDVRLREQEKNQETIKVLSMQIGSHFLYNTLNTIRWMAVLNRQPQIKDMVNSLIRLLMSVTYHQGEEIPLRDELDLVRSYAVIQKARFANFEIEYEIPESLMEMRVLKLILQPVIENCILHAFPGGKAIGVVRISAERRGGALLLTVRDNGRGFDGDAFDPDKAASRQDGSVGLRNINQRLKLNYGDAYGIEVSSRPGSGAVVTLRLPAREEGEGAWPAS